MSEQTASPSPFISVVVPAYNEEANLANLWHRLKPVLDGLTDRWEVVFVDDGSADNTLKVLMDLHGSDPSHIVVVELAHNSGQHPAIFAGMSKARGEVVVTIDADLQNPPEEIPKLVNAMREHGWEVVGSIRRNRQDNFMRRLASNMVARFARRITKAPLRDWGSMLRAYARPVVDRMLNNPEHATYIPALATIYTKKVGEVETAHCARVAGVSNYSLTKLIDLYLDLMTSFSTWPLKVLFYVGLLLSLLGFLLALVLIAGRILMGDTWAEQGVFTLFSVLFFFVGAQFLAFGVLGQYVTRIYREVRKRPPYVVKDVTGGNGG